MGGMPVGALSEVALYKGLRRAGFRDVSIRPIESWPFRYWLASRTMYARSMFLNQAVCATMIAAAVAPMMSVSTMTST